MYQRILVPIDGSDTAERALREALKLAGDKAQLRLLHVVEEIYPLDAEGYAFIDYAALRDVARSSGERLLAKAGEMASQAGAAVDTLLLEAEGERVASVIDREAGNWPADLIVIGSHGRTGFSRMLFGSVAEGVVRGASVPVLLVRGDDQ
ncbi:MAG: universal stress protein [Gallionella sp.]|nr:universal stress protein [Gallionella sp.]